MKKNFIFSLLLIVLFKVNNSVAQCSPLYEESNGKLIIEAENLGTTGSWSKLTTTSGFTGSSYISWQGADSFNNPNQGVTNLQFRITTPGKYLFQWRTKVGQGTSPTDFNDTWLKFPDASSFYGQKGNTTAKVYPKGSGLSPNPNGAGANGFFKVYSTGTTNWTWKSKVSDNDAHDVYVEFNSAGVYTLQIAARSKNHLIDRITLSRTGDATALTLQETKCSSTTNPNPINIPNGQVNVLGELKKWHKVTLAMGGPFSSETANPNPAMDYKLTGIFTNGSQTFTVPGYFAADGDAGNSSATSGNVWKIHFTPPSTGTWNYTIRLRSGSKVAINSNITAGTAVTPLDGKTGTFTIAATNKTGRDLRAKGRLQYVGEHYLKFAEKGEWFLKAGPDSPENLLAYEDFDNTPNEGSRRKSYAPHAQDYVNGDPSWQSGKGTELIGAINYLASKGTNSISFLTMNINGDDKNVYPYLTTTNFQQFDCSKLDQWEIVLEHAEKKGMHLHFKTSETENEMLLDNGNLGDNRKVYYRQLIARFGHHLALNWNMGEENGDYGSTNQNDEQRIAMAQYFYDNDPYKHNVVVHTAPNSYDKIYTPLLGNAAKYTGVSLQTGWNNVHNLTKEWVEKSATAGKKWIVANDEQGSAGIGVPEDTYTGSPNKNDIRQQTLWGNLTASGAGVEYYFGYQRPDSDLSLQDFRSRDQSWNYCKIALDFFNQYIPFWEMSNADNITTGTNTYTLAKAGQVYVVYLRNGGGASVNLPTGNYTVKWYNPRSGGTLQNGNVTTVSGGGTKSIGNAPDSNDWVALIRNTNFTHSGNPSTGNATVAVTSVSVSPTSATLSAIGATRNLSATITPSNATNQNVSWSSSNTNVAAINSNGIVTAVANGTATITVTTQDGNKTATSQITVSVATVGQTAYPSGTPHPIPGTIESENYDTGGQGIAYNDTNTANSGNEYRPTEGVDVQTAGEGGFNVGWTQNGEWLEYTVNVARAGNYKMDIRYAALSSTGTIHVEFNGANVTQAISLSPTGAWQTYTTESKTVTLNAGNQVMRVAIDAGGINLNKITFTEIVPVNQTYTLSPIEDAYLQGSTRYNSEDLRVESGVRRSYLQFDLSGVSGTITEASLKLGVSSDPGNGTIVINKGNSNNWTENNITTSNAPTPGTLLGTLNATYNSGEFYTWTLTPASISSGAILSLVVTHTSGNDVSFGSDENPNVTSRPILTIKTSSNSAKVVASSLFTMYPNPALNDNDITIQLKDSEKGSVRITNMSGKVVYETTSSNKEFKIDPSKLSEKGIYFITIQSENKVETQKLIVN